MKLSRFSPQQKQQFQTIIANSQNNLAAFRSLNLSDSQKTEIWQIMQSTRSQVEDILTEEQKQKLQQLRQNWRSRRPRLNR